MSEIPFDRVPAAGLDPTSFSDILHRAKPTAVPDFDSGVGAQAPHSTTILALLFKHGVVIAGDRRATEGYSIAHRSIKKVFATDDSSAIAIAGAAGPAIEMTRLFQTQIEHYEKIEGQRLTLEGKANQLAQMLRQNLTMAMQGLVVVPLFVGFDERAGEGRIFKYDILGGRYEQSDFWATGSGGRDAKATLKKRYRPGLSRDEAVTFALEALYDASEEDVATGGPDVLRSIYPNIAAITSDGFVEITDEEIAGLFDVLLTQRGAAQIGKEKIPDDIARGS